MTAPSTPGPQIELNSLGLTLLIPWAWSWLAGQCIDTRPIQVEHHSIITPNMDRAHNIVDTPQPLSTEVGPTLSIMIYRREQIAHESILEYRMRGGQ